MAKSGPEGRAKGLTGIPGASFLSLRGGTAASLRGPKGRISPLLRKIA